MRSAINFVCVLVAWILAATSYDLQAKNGLEMIEGSVLSARAGTLVVKDENNKDHTHAVDASAQIMVEGKMAQLEDMRLGMNAHVTLDAGKVIAVSATKPTRSAAASR
jgi:hypothetical protein